MRDKDIEREAALARKQRAPLEQQAAVQAAARAAWAAREHSASVERLLRESAPRACCSGACARARRSGASVRRCERVCARCRDSRAPDGGAAGQAGDEARGDATERAMARALSTPMR